MSDSPPRVVEITNRYELILKYPPTEEEIMLLRAPFELWWYDRYNRDLTTIRASALKNRLKQVLGFGLVTVVGYGRIEDAVPKAPYDRATKKYVPDAETTALFEGALQVWRRGTAGQPAELRFQLPFFGLWPVRESPGDAIKGAQTHGLSKVCNEYFGMCQQMYDGCIEVVEADYDGSNGIPRGKKVVTVIDPSQTLWEPEAPSGNAPPAPAPGPELTDLTKDRQLQEHKKWIGGQAKGKEAAFREFRKQWWEGQGMPDVAVGEMNLEQISVFRGHVEKKWRA